MHHARGDAAGKRQPLVVVLKLDRPRHVGLASDEPVFLLGFQMAHPSLGRGDIEVLTDFPHGGTITAVADFVSNEFVDELLPSGQTLHFSHASHPGFVCREGTASCYGSPRHSKYNIRLFTVKSVCTVNSKVFSDGLLR